MIDWTHFTPGSALAGGLLIGLAAAITALAAGRIAGISGIIGGLLRPTSPADRAWRIAFLGGLLAAPWLAPAFWTVARPEVTSSPGTMIVAGLLVGFGSRLGSGCTSGHGVCGLSRLSPRSMAATLCFMGAGFVTVFVVRHLLA